MKVLLAALTLALVLVGNHAQSGWVAEAMAGSDDVVVAVSEFKNLDGNSANDPLRKGLAEMFLTDFSNAPDVRVVERSRLAAILNELKLQKNPYFDPASAVKLGKGLGASFLVTGSYAEASGTLTINARVIDVATSEVVIAGKGAGDTKDWTTIYNKLSRTLIEGLTGKLSPIKAKKIGRANTSSYSAFKAFAQSLYRMDEGDTEGAADEAAKAIKLDPDFKAAKAQKARVESMRKALDLNTHKASIEAIAVYEGDTPCDCSYEFAEGKKPADWSKLSAGSQLAKRVIKTRTGQRLTSAVNYIAPLAVASHMVKVGLREDARKLVDVFLSEDFLSQALLKGIPRCVGYQFRSLLHYLDLEFEEAMKWQVKASEIPTTLYKMAQFRDQCMGGMLWSMAFGFEGLSGPLKDRIVAATNGNNLGKLRLEQQLAKQIAPKVRKNIEALKVAGKGCAQRCSVGAATGGLRGLQMRLIQGSIPPETFAAYIDSGVKPDDALFTLAIGMSRGSDPTPLGKIMLEKGYIPSKRSLQLAKMKGLTTLFEAMQARIKTASPKEIQAAKAAERAKAVTDAKQYYEKQIRMGWANAFLMRNREGVIAVGLFNSKSHSGGLKGVKFALDGGPWKDWPVEKRSYGVPIHPLWDTTAELENFQEQGDFKKLKVKLIYADGSESPEKLYLIDRSRL